MKKFPSDFSMPAAAVLALAVCCGAPLAVAFLLTTGLGAALLAQGWFLAGFALIVLGIVLGLVLGARYLLRARSRSDAPSRTAAKDCCAPMPRAKEDRST